MTNLEKSSYVVALALPLLAGAWWAGSGYVEFADRLSAIEHELEDLHDLRARYEREQAKNDLINEHVEKMEAELDMLRWHHHAVPGGGDTGRGHVD